MLGAVFAHYFQGVHEGFQRICPRFQQIKAFVGALASSLAFTVGKVAVAVAPRDFKITYGFQQPLIVPLTPHHDWIKPVKNELIDRPLGCLTVVSKNRLSILSWDILVTWSKQRN